MARPAGSLSQVAKKCETETTQTLYDKPHKLEALFWTRTLGLCYPAGVGMPDAGGGLSL